MAERILITAFKPFGIKGAITQTNASRQVLSSIKQRHGDKFDYLILPVNDECEEIVRNYLEENSPGAVVSMGELLTLPSDDIRYEPSAIQAPISIWPRLGRGRPLSSVLTQTMLGLECDPETTTIGLYYCNRVYLKSLEWGRRYNKPSVFFHIPAIGNRKKHTEQVLGKIAGLAQNI